jgi:hypothetical protein
MTNAMIRVKTVHKTAEMQAGKGLERIEPFAFIL